MDACASFTELYQRLAHLEADTHLHIFKENAVLFRASVGLEAKRSPRRPNGDTGTGRENG